MQAWAREYFQGVADARRALERQGALIAARRDRMFALQSPLAGGTHSGTPTDWTNRVDATIDAEDNDGLAWARATIAECRALLAELRGSCKGTLLAATFAAEARYLEGMSIRRTARALDVAPSTVYAYLAALMDYLDYVGPSIRHAQSHGEPT